MKKIIIYCSLICILFSCKETDRKAKKKDTPAALTDQKSYEIISKRGREDLIENLYGELINKDSMLYKVYQNMREIENGKSDSLETFHTFNNNNQDYFASANQHVTQIKDSTLRKTLSAIIIKNLEKYDSRISTHKNLINSIDSKLIIMNDLEIALKISKTMPLIEKFQREHLPSKNPIFDLSNKIDRTIKLADTLYKN